MSLLVVLEYISLIDFMVNISGTAYQFVWYNR